MKNISLYFKCILVSFFILISGWVHSQTNTLTVNGKYLIGVCGDTVVLRGVNYAPYNWSYDATDIKFAEIEQSGANCVRIPWYTSSLTGGGSLYDQLPFLDSALSLCVQNKMIAILELHDLTGDPDFNKIITLSQWYLQPTVLNMINRYNHNLIINIANEAGAVISPQQLVDFNIIYSNVVNSLRNSGIEVPLMIDAPNNGTDIDLLTAIAPTLQANDPLGRLLFSAHVYWYYYANNDSAIFYNKLSNAMSTNVPVVLGEVCNLQYGTTPCQLTLNYTALLAICEQLQISWLAWTWDHDACSDSQLSTNGNYNSLSAFGGDIVNNSNYGLHTHAHRTLFLENNQTCTTGINENAFIKELWKTFSSNGLLTVQSLVSEKLSLTITDITGKIVQIASLNGMSHLTISLNRGIYLISTNSMTGLYSCKVLL